MKLSEIRLEDGRNCANLINFLKSAKWELSGNDAEVLTSVRKWVHDLAMQMAPQLKSQDQPAPPPSSSGFKVRSMGPLPSGSLKSSGSKSKKRK